MSLRFKLISLNCRYTHSCLALYYVRHALELNLPGSSAEISQYTINDPYYDTLIRISSSEADVLCFSVYIWNAQYVSRLVNDLALISPGRSIVLGGPQASSLEELPSACTVVKGEIEGIGKQFYQDLDGGKLQEVYQTSSGKAFPFPYRDDDFKTGLQNRQVYYESSRGCPFRCSYCLSSIGQKVGHKEVDVVKEELDSILAHTPKIIKFVDRTFNDKPDRALEIWRHLIAKQGRTRYHFEIAPDRFSEEMFTVLEAVGPDQFQFEIGIQSTNPDTLDAINRNMDVGIAAKNITHLVKLDTIHLHVDLILGLPFETRESFESSFNRVFSLEPHYIQMGLLKVLRDTPIRSQAEEYGLVFCNQPPYEVLANRWLDHQALSRLYLLCECIEAFYNNRYFRTLWTYLVQRGEEGFSFFEKLLALCEQHQFFDLSHTQELLARILCKLAEQRPDRELVLDILRYDWLRCGHRFLPACLEEKPLAETRLTMRQILPPSMEGLYEPMGRSEFLKRGVFLKVSSGVLEVAGLDHKGLDAFVCFLPDQTTGVIKHSQVVLLEGIS